MPSDVLYEERVSSRFTTALFWGLTLLFAGLSAWRLTSGSSPALIALLICFSALLLFYSVNYKMLVIRLTPDDLKLIFGVFAWTVPLDTVEACGLDDPPVFLKYGGAGIHFMFVRGRYRASFNFLEHPRVVIALAKRRGPVRDVSFSTRRPDQVIRLLQAALSARGAAYPLTRAQEGHQDH